jgi:hypothetical protein
MREVVQQAHQRQAAAVQQPAVGQGPQLWQQGRQQQQQEQQQGQQQVQQQVVVLLHRQLPSASKQYSLLQVLPAVQALLLPREQYLCRCLFWMQLRSGAWWVRQQQGCHLCGPLGSWQEQRQ